MCIPIPDFIWLLHYVMNSEQFVSLCLCAPSIWKKKQNCGLYITWQPGVELTASATASPAICCTQAGVCPRGESRERRTWTENNAQPTGLNQTFPPRPA